MAVAVLAAVVGAGAAAGLATGVAAGLAAAAGAPAGLGGAAASPCASRNTATACTSWLAWLRRLSDAAALSSTSAAFCCVARSICVTASPTWVTPEACSRLAALISATMSVTRWIACTTSPMVAPALFTSALPCSTRSTLVAISVLIWRAASAARCARLRTSPATTAKPRPCSPARAASTAAFSARMLVWKAMPSMVPMMSAIWREESSMLRIVSTTRSTTSPPWRATSEAFSASWLACCALSAFSLTVLDSCSIDAAVCCSALACCSVRALRSLLPAAICALAVATPSAPWRTPATMPRSLACMSARAVSRRPSSSRLPAGMVRLRSPLAMHPASVTACSAVRDSRPDRTIATLMPASSEPSPATSSSQRARLNALLPAAALASAPWVLISTSFFTASAVWSNTAPDCTSSASRPFSSPALARRSTSACRPA